MMNALLFIVLLITHFVAVKTFTEGFFRKRQPFLDISQSVATTTQTSLITHRRAIILVVDALRFDFLVSDMPSSVQSFSYHNVLTLPRELSENHPYQSFVFNAYADPPTTTLQRVKAIATGLLPTFIDARSNLGGSSIPDDSFLKQAKLNGKKIAFLGDDTWMALFPDEFSENMTFAYSFLNVEDLHTVDNGIVEHLFPLMENNPGPQFDILVAQFLGVDHVGHRVGPDHPRMCTKLEQMNDILDRIVSLLDDDTLLVLLGDHGMDYLGSHCGDSTLEASAAMWIYSKGIRKTNSQTLIPPTLSTRTIFPGSPSPHRSIQQIDLLPTLSLLLGLPIPFNNLGTVIPELFPDASNLRAALEINAHQIDQYLDTYRQSPQGRDLDPVWDRLQRSRESVQESRIRVREQHHEGQIDADRTEALAAHTRMALAACRQIWARFDLHKMVAGLVLMSLAVMGNLYHFQWAGIKQSSIRKAPTLTAVLVPAAHACTLALPTLSAWEDRVVALLLHASILPYLLIAFDRPHPRSKSSLQKPLAPTTADVQVQPRAANLRQNLLRSCAAFIVCTHLTALSTICREEQFPYCRVTFYSTYPGFGTAPPLFALVLSIPASLALPTFVTKLLMHQIRAASGKGDTATRVPGAAAWFLPYVFRLALVGGNLYWIFEWADSGAIFGEVWCPALRLARTWVARLSFGALLIGGAVVLGVSWAHSPRHPSAYGTALSNYLCITLTIFGAVYIPSQLTGQLVLCLTLVALLLYLEIIRSSMILKGTEKKGYDPTFSDIVVLLLLAVLAFYGTGHQATLATLQLKSAFLVHPTVVYPYSRITLVLNSLGSFIFVGFAAPLLPLWTSDRVPGRKIQYLGASIQLTRYCSIILCACMADIIVFTSHPLVWKVVAPRYVLSVMVLVIFDLTTGVACALLLWIAGRMI